MQIHGPAATLAMSLMKLGWKVTRQGKIHTDTMLNLDLLKSPLASLMKCTMNSWMKNISQIYLTRPDWRNLPTIDRTATVKIFMKLSSAQQSVVARFLTGSYMESKQKEHVRDGPVICELCKKEEDTMNHRLLNCPSTEYIRQNSPEIVEFLHSHDLCHLHLPVVYQDDFHDFNTWFLHQEWDQEVNQSILQQIQQENQQGTRSMIFSDGSCRNPASPDFRRASFALIFHHKVDPQICANILQTFADQKQIPNTFQVLATGPCTNFQSIPRAELLAAMVLMQQRLCTTLYTDSQYVVDICSKLGYILDIAQCQSWANFDILVTIWESLQLGQTYIEKVKAHDMDSTLVPSMMNFWKLGNHAADTAAKAALKHLDAVSPMHTNFPERQEYILMVRQQMEFRYNIQVARAKCFQHNEANQNTCNYSTYQANLDKLMDLQYDDFQTYTFSQDDYDSLENSLWGTTISHRLLTWLAMLQWSKTPSTKGETGITWYELAVNFQTVMQCGLVVNIGTTGNKFLPKQLSLHSKEYPYSRQVAAFERAITTIATLVQREVLPCRRQLSSSLRLLGATHGKQGLIDRPVMPRQRQTLESIKAHFLRHRGTTPEEAPEIPQLEPHMTIEQHWTDGRDQQDWKNRIKNYNSARKRR